jgi:hypothetical protein
MRAIEKVKSITICGKRYKFGLKRLRQARGLTDHPKTKNKGVSIDVREHGKKLLATLLDELIHCAIWEIDNTVVDTISDDMAEVLWRCGLRFVDEEPPVIPKLTKKAKKVIRRVDNLYSVS